MTPNTPAAPADPVLLALLGGWLAAEALAALLIAAVALLSAMQEGLQTGSIPGVADTL